MQHSSAPLTAPHQYLIEQYSKFSAIATIAFLSQIATLPTKPYGM
ncbi:hypothetical protein [Gloeocapsopsis dulcis]|nr:hypothetical protein [Gloeocapsopsis dulcis]WNN90677.1 hypothetical protein P0S91_06230 [Gloeocapsopsis dulcis]